MTNKLPYQTVQDETLTHQVVFKIHEGKTKVTCNCLFSRDEKSHKFYWQFMGPAKNLSEARELYNDPYNHNAPFAILDEAKW